MTAPKRRDTPEPDLETVLLAEMRHHLSVDKATKRSALRLALTSAIRDGVLKPGERLPAETDLARMLGVSLGTVQNALGQIQDLGLVVRRRGDGTRVLDDTAMAPSVWHFRFRVRQTGLPFRTANQEIEILQTSARGPWTDHLGAVPDYTVIRRVYAGEDGLRLGAEMYLDAARVPAHELSASELKSTNLRPLLEQHCNLKVKTARHEAYCDEIPPREAGLFSMPFKTMCFRIEARAFTDKNTPFYFQNIFAPVDKLALIF